jgi:hypothetical protein
MTALQRLEAFLDDLQEPVEQTHFTIQNEGQANWALRKISQSQKRMQELQNVADEEIHKIEKWLLSDLAKEEKSVEFFTNLLNIYHLKLYEQDPKQYKSIRLPNGKLTRVKSQPTFERDEEVLLKWLQERGMESFIERKVKPRWGEFKKRVRVSGNNCIIPDTGELVEGVTVIPQEEKFKVEVLN